VAKEKVVSSLTDFYEAFRQAIVELHHEHGPLYLAMVVQFGPEPEDEWTFLVGSRALARDALNGATIVAKKLSARVPPEVTRKVRRIGIIRETDPLFSAIARSISVDVGGLCQIESSTFDGIHVERGALFASRRQADGKRARTPKQQR
jgi:hypothetical protein